jgi:hypothetical protein
MGLGPFQSPIKCVSGALSLEQSIGSVKLGTYLSSRAEVKHPSKFSERCSCERSEELHLNVDRSHPVVFSNMITDLFRQNTTRIYIAH